ncbi:hypothetical protein ACFOUP_03550 [Belliella kenyensis]|uniref:Glycerophosphoryl diester phosphodiesterase membrane domain-containing protein n=1 Tax=Belliella kenyensis TaxID=1472724 RepID=A0ABV8EHD4_9BACT|nr:hypothetical protein [Belliella kenyensis]MCH7402314.1 hypothetical protein [Belliella kenyensis]MDN3603505.1 hypothetical protein [Belliella kenyensis]
MINGYIQFKKRRELGEILSDTFSFARQNYKPLIAVLIKTSLIPYILVVLASVYYQYVVSDLSRLASIDFIIGIGAMGITSLLFFATSSSTVFSYIKEYETCKGIELDHNYILDEAKSNYGNMIGLSLLAYLMLVFGLIFFVIPGIYFLVPIAMFFPIVLFKEMSIFSSVGESFRLIKDYWWVTFGTLIVTVVVIGIMSFAFSVPSLVYTMVKSMVSISQSGDLTPGIGSQDFIALLLNAIASAGSNLLSVVLLIALGFIYFDLDEEKNRTGLRQKIDELDA